MRYYWLKLKDNFFQQKAIKKLRRIAGGDTYTIIYLKMQLLSIKNEGKLKFDGIEDTFAEEIALDIDEDPDNVKVAMMYLLKNGLMQDISDTEMVMTETLTCIGTEGSSAERVRKHRAKMKEQKELAKLEGSTVETDLETQETLQCNTNVQNGNVEKREKREEKREKRKELELDKEKKGSSSGSDSFFNIAKYMQQHGFISLSPVLLEKIESDIEIYSLDEVKKAIEIADNNAKHSYSYIKGILEKRRAGVNEKLDKEQKVNKALEEFVGDDEE